MLELGLKTLIAYLTGSLMGALFVGAARGGVDIRRLGSGNPGGTNAFRTQGFAFALATAAIDVGKGWLAAGWLPGLALPGVAADPSIDREWLAAACALAAMCGHVWPLYHEFRGGKGGATLMGCLLAAAPMLVLIALGAWFAVVLLSGFIGLATTIAAVAVPAALVLQVAPTPLLAFTLAAAALVTFAHRPNFERMRAGREPRSERLWLLRPRRPRA